MATRQIKSTNYFSHDSNARNDEKLVRLRMKQGAAGYGVYFMILERLREEADYMSAKDYNMIAFDLRVDAAIVKSVVEDFGLFTFTRIELAIPFSIPIASRFVFVTNRSSPTS